MLSVVAVAMSLSVVSCGKTLEQEKQVAAQNAAMTNAKIAEMDEVAKLLYYDGIYVYERAEHEGSSRSRSISKLEDMRSSELASAIRRLEKFASLANEALTYGSAKNVELRGKETIRRAGKLAARLAIEAREIQANKND